MGCGPTVIVKLFGLAGAAIRVALTWPAYARFGAEFDDAETSAMLGADMPAVV